MPGVGGDSGRGGMRFIAAHDLKAAVSGSTNLGGPALLQLVVGVDVLNAGEEQGGRCMACQGHHGLRTAGLRSDDQGASYVVVC
jgi:hypothetical protein